MAGPQDGPVIQVALRHSFPGVALDITFDAPNPGITTLFGPSGAGKSTVISAIAGLLRPASGRIAIGGAVLWDSAAGAWTRPERRRIGVVFQDARLFPHLSVAGNLRYGLRRAPPGALSLGDVVGLLAIGDLLDRRPPTLSGGERQRVAIGRALLCQPRLLLMDEPLASLDAPRRAEILPYLKLLRQTGLPILYVTHAIEEVWRLADHVVLLDAGRVAADGSPQALSARGDIPLLAERDDAAAVLNAAVAWHDPARGLTRLRFTAGASSEQSSGHLGVLVPLRSEPFGTQMRVRVPAREVILAAAAPNAISVQNVMSGRVRRVLTPQPSRGALVEVTLTSDAYGPGPVLLARITLDAVTRLGLAEGVPVFALVKSTSLDVLD